MGFKNFNNMDYSFFDLYVDDYEYEEVAKTLTVNCKYRGVENTKIVFYGVVKTEYLSILPVHTIEYINIERDDGLGIWKFYHLHKHKFLCEQNPQ